MNELKLTLALYFRDGLIQGIKNAWGMRNIGLGMLLAKRLNPLELFHEETCKDQEGIRKMLAKARELENKRRGFSKE